MEAIVRLKRELAYQGTVLKIYRDTVISNGIEEVFDYIHHNGAAAVLPVFFQNPSSESGRWPDNCSTGNP